MSAMANVSFPGLSPPGYPDRVAPSCESYYDEIRHVLDTTLASEPSHLANRTLDEQRYLAIELAVETYAAPAICFFGIVGNILNLVVLTRKSLTHSMDYMEKSAHMGLVALAVSDMCFCIVYLIKVLIPEKVIYLSISDWLLGLYYNTHNEGLINLFIFSSTWLTVIMALGRYVAVCRPLHARSFINLTATRISIAIVFLASIIINIPRFLHYTVTEFTCHSFMFGSNISRPPDNTTCPCHVYHKDIGDLYKDKDFVFYYNLAWSIVAVLIPLVVLTVCNVCLIRALRQSYRLQMIHRANRPKDSGHAITPTLVALILMFIVLVCPSGIFAFFRIYVLEPKASTGRYFGYMMAQLFVNNLVLVNFAMNFVLYCVINSQFRKVTVELVTCAWVRRRKRKARFDSVYSRTSHNTATMNLSEMETEL